MEMNIAALKKELKEAEERMEDAREKRDMFVHNNSEGYNKAQTKYDNIRYKVMKLKNKIKKAEESLEYELDSAINSIISEEIKADLIVTNTQKEPGERVIPLYIGDVGVTIKQVMEKINKKINIPIDRQRLIHHERKHDKKLDDKEMSLRDYEIKLPAILKLIIISPENERGQTVGGRKRRKSKKGRKSKKARKSKKRRSSKKAKRSRKRKRRR